MDVIYKNHFLGTVLNILKLLGFLILLALFLRTFVFTTGIVDGRSMEPTFYDTDSFIVFKTPLLFREPKRGDIVQLVYRPNGEHLVKRIIGLPGETLEIKRNGVYLRKLDGSELLLEEEYLADTTRTLAPTEHATIYGPLGPHEYFVLGDNREHSSADSRRLGAIPRQWILGLIIPLF